MSNERLFSNPEPVSETLEAIIQGAETIDDIRDRLDLPKQSKVIHNRIHDLLRLELIKKKGDQIKPTEAARRFIQLDDNTPVKERFESLPEVIEIFSRYEDEEDVTLEKIGRLVAFESGSSATKPSTFKKYGRIYANWMDYLDLDDIVIISDFEPSSIPDVLSNPHGSRYPKVRPQKAIRVLNMIEDFDSVDELSQSSNMSKQTVSKALSTLYSLQLAERTRGYGFSITDIGVEFLKGDETQRKKIIRDCLLEIPFFIAYCNRVPDSNFKHRDIIIRISEDFNQNWSESTIETVSKRTYQWLLYSGLCSEIRSGHLQSTKYLRDRSISEIS